MNNTNIAAVRTCVLRATQVVNILAFLFPNKYAIIVSVGLMVSADESADHRNVT